MKDTTTASPSADHNSATETPDSNVRIKTVPNKDQDDVSASSRNGTASSRTHGPCHTRRPWLNRNEGLAAGVVTVVAALVRLHRLPDPAAVVFDETHFVRFAMHYLRGHFFFDIHPPLGKIIFATVAHLSGMSAAFDPSSIGATTPALDKIGLPYPEGVDYVTLRLVSVVAGVALVPLCWGIVRRLGYGVVGGLCAGIAVAFDNALVITSRVVMLDALLLACMFLAMYAVLCVHDDERSEFTMRYFAALAVAGTALGCAVSIKLVGMGAVAVIGVISLAQLWEVWGEHHRPVRRFAKHVAARLCLLLCLPTALYVTIFALHLDLVPKSGPGDSFVSRAFQQTIDGNGFAQASHAPSQHVHAHSSVTVRRMYGAECWLTIVTASDGESAPMCISGATEQIASLWWELVPVHGASSRLEHNSVTLLRHVETGSFLRATADLQLEVVAAAPAAQDWKSVADLADALWRIELLGQEDAILRSPSSLLRLAHVNSSSALQCTNIGITTSTYPCQIGRNVHDTSGGWHFDRLNVHDTDTAFVTEDTSNELGTSISETMTTMDKIVELHSIIFARNNEMSGEHRYGSRPSDWPLLYRGLAYWHASDSELETPASCTTQVYLLGNPAVWWGALCALPFYVVTEIAYTVREKRGCRDVSPKSRARLVTSGRLLLFGWLVHYVPFFFFGRLLFLHHYLPALVFSIMLLAIVVDHASSHWIGNAMAAHALVAFSALVVGCFIAFAPLVYATTMCPNERARRQWRSAWDF